MKAYGKILNDPNKTIWERMKEFINTKQPGDIITRQQLFKSIYNNKFKIHSHTIDAYRNSLTRVGILKKTTTPGTYIKMINIPPNISCAEMKKFASDKSWRVWFISPEDRMQKN